MCFMKNLFKVKSKVIEKPSTQKSQSVFKSIRIGKQVWMAENLNVGHYRNGDPIDHVQDEKKWNDLKSGAWCYYRNDSEEGEIYGKLYNWYAVTDPRGLAPEGWHIPSDEEWKILEMYLGMSKSDVEKEGLRGNGVGGKMKEAGPAHWNTPNFDANNTSGFCALAAGFRVEHGDLSCGGQAQFWSSSENSFLTAWSRFLRCGSSEVSRGPSSKYFGFSVRCIKD